MLFTFICRCVCVHMNVTTLMEVREQSRSLFSISEIDNYLLNKNHKAGPTTVSSLLSYHMSPWNQTQVIKLGDDHLYLMSPLMNHGT